MTVIEGIILGILQGIAEFLPISSSGHLLLLQRVFGIEDNLFSFSIVVHVGSLIPVLVIYFSRIKSILFKPFQKITWLLILGTLPAVFVALFLEDLIDTLFTGDFIAVGFIITAIVMFLVDKAETGEKTEDDISIKDALIIGTAQALAIVPGISRSGSTIFGGITRGLNRKSAANFSFLLSIPAIAGATVLELFNHISSDYVAGDFFLTAPVIAGFFASMIAGFFAIKIMLKLIVAAKMKYFSYYLLVIAALIIFDQFFTNIVF